VHDTHTLCNFGEGEEKRREEKEKRGKGEEKEKKKEKVGFFLPNLAFFGDQKNRHHELNLHFFLKRYGSCRDTSSPHTIQKI